MNKTSHFIVTIHNKQDLIESVLQGIVNSTKDTTYKVNIICVLDGCTDNSELIIDAFVNSNKDIDIHKLYQNDVHELLSLNAAFRYIETLDSTKDDLIFLLQDDVILKEEHLNEYMEGLYKNYDNLGYISFRCGLSTNLQHGLLYEHNFIESVDGHWSQLKLDHFHKMENRDFGFVEIAIKSPTCIKKSVLDTVGYFDENLAPFGHDDLDLCIRLNKLGYKNAVFGASFDSKLDWGGTREAKNQSKPYHKQYNDIILRNKIYLTHKHADYYAAK